jgi:hypothetical protein
VRTRRDRAAIDTSSSLEAKVGMELGGVLSTKPRDMKCRDLSEDKEAKWARARVLRTRVLR